MNPCVELYKISANAIEYGNIDGICRITGQKSKGLLFSKWVKDTFTNFDYLFDGAIISNEALFCFEESSTLLQQKTGRDKPQRFRTYSHIITKNDEWIICTKANKAEIVQILHDNPKIVCLTDSGQKHIFFKNRVGMWQLDDSFIAPNIAEFDLLHGVMMQLLELGFTQGEVISGNYSPVRVLKVGIAAWQNLENKIKNQRGEPLFDFAAWLMFTIKNSDNDI